MSSQQILIPCSASDHAVTVDVNNLPDARAIGEVLAAESVPLSLWIQFGQAYLAQGNTTEYKNFLDAVTGDDVQNYYSKPDQPGQDTGYYPGVEYERIQLFCSLADFYTKKAQEESSQSERLKVLDSAQTYIQKAQRLGSHEQLPRIAMARVSLAKARQCLWALSHKLQQTAC